MLLFTPIKIGNVELKNRIVMPSITNAYAKDGYMSDAAIEYYSARARGGTAMICVEDGVVDYPRGNNIRNPMAVDDDKYIPMLAKLASAIKKNGSVAAIQLAHAGRRAARVNAEGKMETTQGLMGVAPSLIAHPGTGCVVPKELDIDEIEELIEKFGQAARRCAEAGFDVIGLHSAHIYLCGQFLSPWANVRRDKYGGSLVNRARFVLQVLSRMKKELGSIPLMIRMNGAEPKGGNTPEEIREIARMVELAGVNAISVSSGFGPVVKMRDVVSTQAPIGTPEGLLVPTAENIKAGVSIPVMVGNVIRDPEFMEQIIREGKCDIITLARPLLADPDWVKKVSTGHYEDVRPCISCCMGCQTSVVTGKHMTCILNPLVGKETDPELQIKKTDSPKKILVVGAGPAGLETALIAAERGHDVTIWEKSEKLGGTVLLAAIPPRKEVINKITEYFETRLKKSNAKITFGKEATLDNIKDFKPDKVVVAAGSRSFIPPIKGIDSGIVRIAYDVLRQEDIKKDVYAKNVVIIGGGQVGIEVAEYLVEMSALVTVVEPRDMVGIGMYLVTRQHVLDNLEDHNTRIVTNAQVKEIDENGVRIEKKGIEEYLPADIVVLSTGIIPQKEYADQLLQEGFEAYAVGDSAAAGDIMSAVHAGYKLGLTL